MYQCQCFVKVGWRDENHISYLEKMKWILWLMRATMQKLLLCSFHTVLLIKCSISFGINDFLSDSQLPEEKDGWFSPINVSISILIMSISFSVSSNCGLQENSGKARQRTSGQCHGSCWGQVQSSGTRISFWTGTSFSTLHKNVACSYPKVIFFVGPTSMYLTLIS